MPNKEQFPDFKRNFSTATVGDIVEGIHELFHASEFEIADEKLAELKGFVRLSSETPNLTWEDKRQLVVLKIHHSPQPDHSLEPLTQNEEVV